MKKITEKQKRNAFGILDALAKSSITSPELRIGILCVAAKESGLIPRREKSYANTSNERIRKIFGRKKLGSMFDNDNRLSEIKKNPRFFFNKIYCNVAGNRSISDGYNYRGGGYVQLTGLGNYRASQNATGWALVDRPSLITWKECAADVLVAFFERSLNSRKTMEKAGEFFIDRWEQSDGYNFGLFISVWINAGIGKKPESPAVQRAYKNAMEWLPTAQAIYQEWSEKR